MAIIKKKNVAHVETLADQIATGKLMGDIARTIFTDTVDKLAEANEVLEEAQKKAEAIIAENQAIVDTANLHKINNLKTIKNLMKVMGAE